MVPSSCRRRRYVGDLPPVPAAHRQRRLRPDFPLLHSGRGCRVAGQEAGSSGFGNPHLSESQSFRISEFGIHEERDLVEVWMIHSTTWKFFVHTVGNVSSKEIRPPASKSPGWVGGAPSAELAAPSVRRRFFCETRRSGLACFRTRHQQHEIYPLSI